MGLPIQCCPLWSQTGSTAPEKHMPDYREQKPGHRPEESDSPENARKQATEAWWCSHKHTSLSNLAVSSSSIFLRVSGTVLAYSFSRMIGGAFAKERIFCTTANELVSLMAVMGRGKFRFSSFGVFPYLAINRVSVRSRTHIIHCRGLLLRLKGLVTFTYCVIAGLIT